MWLSSCISLHLLYIHNGDEPSEKENATATFTVQSASRKSSPVLMPKTITVLLAIKEQQTLYSFILLLLNKIRPRASQLPVGQMWSRDWASCSIKPGRGYFSARHSVLLPRPLKCVRKTGRCCRQTDTHSKPVFLNRRAAARYRALASIIPDRERPEETTICYKISLIQLITNLNVISYLLTCHTVYISVLILFMIMP